MKSGKGEVTSKRPNKKSFNTDYIHNLISAYLFIYLSISIYIYIYLYMVFRADPKCLDLISKVELSRTAYVSAISVYLGI